MKGDFSRITYNERKHYSLVLMQQGRVQLDSDWNEQALLHWIGVQNLTEDLVGGHGGPRNRYGFEITQRTDENGNPMPSDFTVGRGRYYVRGVVCENDTDIAYTQQNAFPLPDTAGIASGKKYLVYLHVWWRHITHVEDDEIREVALGTPDTASRIQTVWQVKVVEAPGSAKKFKDDYDLFIEFLKKNDVIQRTTGKLQAQALKPSDSDQPCITSPQSRYRGAENHLYRVEIHRSGPACNLDASNTAATCATFKWSRENGSVVLPIVELIGETVTVEHLGRDGRFGLEVGDWVEVVDDDYELQGRIEALFKVIEVDPDTLQVSLSGSPQIDVSRLPLLRRWDHSGDISYEGAAPVEEGKWIELEDGVQIQFSTPPSESNDPYWYQSGAWWWIVARTATGDVEWPRENGQPVEQGPLDAGDRYAPLALVETKSTGIIVIEDYRRMFRELWE